MEVLNMKNTLTDRNGDPVVICATALAPIAFKHIFGADMLKAIIAMRKSTGDKTEMLDITSKMAFVMAAQAANLNDYKAVMSKTVDDYYDFLNQFEGGYFETEQTQVTILGTWFNNADVIDKAKNRQSPPKEN